MPLPHAVHDHPRREWVAFIRNPVRQFAAAAALAILGWLSPAKNSGSPPARRGRAAYNCRGCAAAHPESWKSPPGTPPSLTARAKPGSGSSCFWIRSRCSISSSRVGSSAGGFGVFLSRSAVATGLSNFTACHRSVPTWYHESLLRLDRVAPASVRPNDDAVYFASANDPFVTASTLSRAWREMNARRPVTNLYLCPLATKVQALGFGLFFLSELENSPASIILPSVELVLAGNKHGRGTKRLYPIHLA